MASPTSVYTHVPVLYSDLLRGETQAIDDVATSLKARGYVLLNLRAPSPASTSEASTLRKLVSEAREQAAEFFARPFGEKRAIATPSHDHPILGYFHVGHKETLRGVTQDRLSEYFPEAMRALAKHLDESMPRLIELLLREDLFPAYHTLAELGTEGKLPLLQSGADVTRYGMLDVAHYFNMDVSEPSKQDSSPSSASLPEDGIRRPPSMNTNCTDHYDPGLFALSFLSTAPGLELYDAATKTWNAAPYHPDLSTATDDDYLVILWSGSAAARLSDGRIPPTRHRVQYRPDIATSRMSMWYEVCTDTQDMSAETYASLSGRKVFIPNVGENGYTLDLTNDVPQDVLTGKSDELETQESSSQRVYLSPDGKAASSEPLESTGAKPLLYSRRGPAAVGEGELGLPFSKVESGTLEIPVRREPTLLDNVKATVRSWIGMAPQQLHEEVASNSEVPVLPKKSSSASASASSSPPPPPSSTLNSTPNQAPKYSLRDFEKRTGVPLTKRMVIEPHLLRTADRVGQKEPVMLPLPKPSHSAEANLGLPMSKFIVPQTFDVSKPRLTNLKPALTDPSKALTPEDHDEQVNDDLDELVVPSVTDPSKPLTPKDLDQENDAPLLSDPLGLEVELGLPMSKAMPDL
mmetsp:Transcript_10529/g.32408  ORF Transcript_10529/g.32408 Transcript_10529/m.32408 type:complete len:635 (-) Transcript_10529:50-1954(-)|eukprot:CAMPEP_0174233750 /NCGR_PEP_ID=MMETSP0417-20130205/3710_1 /TAXON_ID=242541 /ORGANISM="Mayorella sp, Strain BSH-02190019" /LENGTH=634 /DNA_ID=CAMNT_0015312015 /DNA_START=110 /DNA_END=2017 /DNA_ORIENTATION=-